MTRTELAIVRTLDLLEALRADYEQRVQYFNEQGKDKAAQYNERIVQRINDNITALESAIITE